MQLLRTLLSMLVMGGLMAVASPVQLETRQSGIDQTTYDNLVRYTKYSSAVYQWICPAPLGNKLVDQFEERWTQGLVARDDKRKEIVVVFRGSLEIGDAFVNIQIAFTSLQTKGVVNSNNARVHTGFLGAYNIVADKVLSLVKSQVSAYPGYTIVVTGHSLGGAVASLAALSIKAAHPSVALKLYTFGQPRTGDAAFASLVEKNIGTSNIFRAVHTYDGVPTILFQSLGYRHFGTEYWHHTDPANRSNVRKCNGAEDPTCSDSIPSTFINPAHISYFGQLMALNPLLCI